MPAKQTKYRVSDIFPFLKETENCMNGLFRYAVPTGYLFEGRFCSFSSGASVSESKVKKGMKQA
ncbi:MAG: hypothetical protein ACLFPE_08310 [Bacteroidales bacterium]